LDGLRAIAVALVVLAHACQTHGFPGGATVRGICVHGGIGVEVFFVISGFLITTLMLRERQRTGSVSIRGFYGRRALRILPAYLAFLAVVLTLVLAGRIALARRDWIAAGTYTMNFLSAPTWEVGHFWSLSIEEHFYLMWPLVVVLGGVAVARRTAIGIIVGCFAVRWVVLLACPSAYASMAEVWTFTRLDTIAFGCLLALVVAEPADCAVLDRLASRTVFIAAAASGLVASITLASFSTKLSVGFAYTVNAALITFLLWAAVKRSGSAVGRLLNHPLVAAVGVGSYSLYLWQQFFLNPHRDAAFTRFPQNVIFAIIAAAASYLLIERPFLRMKGRFAIPANGASRRATPAVRAVAHPAIQPPHAIAAQVE
jgi:peptidoglycan/LPS O-acetylase OafA/YrhL